MNAVAVVGMGLGVFLMYEAYKNELNPLQLLKSILTSTPYGGATGNTAAIAAAASTNTTPTVTGPGATSNLTAAEHVVRPVS